MVCGIPCFILTEILKLIIAIPVVFVVVLGVINMYEKVAAKIKNKLEGKK